MKKGFTLLELIIVILILGILATLAITQYSKMLEKARGAEAKMVLGSIRLQQAAYRAQYYTCANNANADKIGIGTAGYDIPGTSAAACRGSHYFWYGFPTVSATGITAIATRCTSGGKAPTAPAYTMTLQSDFSTNLDTIITTVY